MSEVDDLVQDFVYEYKVFAYHLLVDLAQEVLDDNYNPVKQLKYEAGRDIETCCGYYIDRAFLEVGIKQFWRVLDKVRTEVTIND